jgi:prolyl-tRNA synthetase
MQFSKYLIPTLRETPQDAECKSHRLMLRAGLIRKLASGTYSYLPTGLRSIKKVEAIIRDEMNKAGGIEVLLPAIHPAELWKTTKRWEILGDDMIRFKDRHGKLNVLGPTHEEVITDLVRGEVHSYKQLPMLVYQIQTKFRDELRPRSGVIRSREFIMKDAYSFHDTEDSLDSTYKQMRGAYQRIFKRCGLEAFLVKADPGAMGGSGSQEFLLLSDAGEDQVVQAGDSDTIMAHELAGRALKGLKLPKNNKEPRFKEIDTPGLSSIESVSKFLKTKQQNLVKTIILESVNTPTSKEGIVAVLVRGDHDVSLPKVLNKIKGRVLASSQTIEKLGSAFGYTGPIGLNIPCLIDEDVLELKDFVVGANKEGKHLVDVNVGDLGFDPKRDHVGDYRQVVEGDLASDGKTPLRIKTAIELGHIFKLGLRYSEPLKAHYLDSSGKSKPMIMGCYGIGVNRILAAAIEQSSSDKGIKWTSLKISPFEVVILPLNMKDEKTAQTSMSLYDEMLKKGWDVIIDDRDVTAGVKFNDAELVGIPLQLIIGPKNLKNDQMELRVLPKDEKRLISSKEAVSEIQKLLDSLT